MRRSCQAKLLRRATDARGLARLAVRCGDPRERDRSPLTGGG
jgi:hypothetical protein